MFMWISTTILTQIMDYYIHVGKTKKITRQDKKQLYHKTQNIRYKSMKFCIVWRNKIIKSNIWLKEFDDYTNNTFKDFCSEYKISKEKSINKEIINELNINNNLPDLITRLNYIIKQIRNTMDSEDTLDALEQMKIAIDQHCKNFKE